MPEAQHTGQLHFSLIPSSEHQSISLLPGDKLVHKTPHCPDGLFFGMAYKQVDSLFESVSHFLLFLSCTLLYHKAYVFVPRNTIINSYVSGT